ncbi:MAG: tetratricopeptide repeat protein [Candidatus Brocadiales bacterium]|nr:tetratricopeptide repeat protein [Candidatus Brocadiales bacterium]
MHSKTMRLVNSTKRLQSETIYAVLGLIILSFAAYLHTLSNKFVFDDVYIISENYFIRDWRNFWGLFTSKYFAASGELSYRPVTTLSYFMDFSLWHLNPMGYHLTNIILHTLNSALLFFLVRHIARNTPVAFLASLFFVCHPVLSEAVNAVSYREDLLAATFSIIAFILYVRLSARNKFTYGNFNFYLYPISLLSYLFALFSKEMAITLPLLLFFFDYLIGNCRTFANRILRFYLGYILVTIFYLLVRFRWFHNPVESGVSYPQESLWHNFLTMPKALASYIRLLFFPVNLNADYIVPVTSSPCDTSFILSLLLIISIAVIAYRLFFRSKLLFFSVLWFFVALLPVLNIIPIANITAERYLYIPMIGFCIMGSYFITHMSTMRLHPFRISVWVLTLSILFGFAWQTSLRSGDWRDEFTLWSKTIAREPNSYKAHSSLGILLIRRGLEEEGISELKTSLSMNPSYPDAHNNMGTLYEQKGMYEDAAKEYRCALRINQNLSEAHYNLGNAYLKTGNYDKAVAEYKLYITSKGDHPIVFYNLGVAYMKQGMLDESIMAFQKSLKNNPMNADVHNNLGVVFTRKGQLNDAVREFREALKYNPGHPDAVSNLEVLNKIR